MPTYIVVQDKWNNEIFRKQGANKETLVELLNKTKVLQH